MSQINPIYVLIKMPELIINYEEFVDSVKTMKPIINKLRISTTEVGSCPRKLLYKERGIDPAPPHMYGIKGTMTHRAIEGILNNEDLSYEYPNLLKYPDGVEEDDYNTLLTDVEVLVSKFRSIQPTLDIQDGGHKEEKLEYTFTYKNIDITLVLKPDYFDDTKLIDFKSGKRLMPSNVEQLAAYKQGIKRVLDLEVEPQILFLGDKATIKKLTPSQLRGGLNDFRNNLQATIHNKIDAIEGRHLPCMVGFGCVFCSYRHVCNGV